MDLTPYLESLRRDLAASAATGSQEVTRAAELLTNAVDASARLCLMEALADAAAEITTKLTEASVEVRLRGRDADLVVTEHEPAPEPVAAAATDPTGDVARITLRLPEPLKEAVERAASIEGVSVNAWLVRAVTAAVHGSGSPRSHGRGRLGRHITGYAQA